MSDHEGYSSLQGYQAVNRGILASLEDLRLHDDNGNTSAAPGKIDGIKVESLEASSVITKSNDYPSDPPQSTEHPDTVHKDSIKGTGIEMGPDASTHNTTDDPEDWTDPETILKLTSEKLLTWSIPKRSLMLETGKFYWECSPKPWKTHSEHSLLASLYEGSMQTSSLDDEAWVKVGEGITRTVRGVTYGWIESCHSRSKVTGFQH